MQIAGTWRLIEWVKVHVSGQSAFPFTERASGRIIYAPGGFMSGFLMHPEWPSHGPLAGVQSAGFIAYSGRYDASDETVSHFVDMASEPRWAGTVLKRYGRIEGETLVLRTSLATTTPDPSGWLHHRLSFVLQ